jgi:hypothetical protein
MRACAGWACPDEGGMVRHAPELADHDAEAVPTRASPCCTCGRGTPGVIAAPRFTGAPLGSRRHQVEATSATIRPLACTQ